MDKLHKYINYSLDDFVEDSLFWKWVLEEEKATNSIWQELIDMIPGKKEVVEQAREKVLQLNTERFRLPTEKVASIWAKIQQSKNEITALDLTDAKLGSSATLTLNSPPAFDIAMLMLALWISLLLA